jgi:hypothetical protein
VTAERPRWQRLVALGLAIAMSVLIAMEGIGRWAFNRGIGSLLEISGSNNAESYARQAERLFAQRNYPAAESFALVALDRSPVHQKALRTLGMARTAMGNSNAGRRAMEAAGRLGWQDVTTQSWLMWDAQQAGKQKEALARADALARRGTMAPGLFRVLTAFAADPATRPLLLARMAKGPEWRVDFFKLSSSATLDEAALTEVLLRQLSRSPAPPARAEVVPVVRRLADLDAYGRAAALSSDLLREGPSAKGELIGDGNFRRFEIYAGKPADHTPFDWDLGDTPGATAVVERPDRPDDGALYVESNGARRAMLASKIVRIPAGAHRLSFTVRGPDPEALDRFRWSLTCVTGKDELMGSAALAPVSQAAGQRSVPFAVPARGCEYQRIQLIANEAAERRYVSAYFDDVSVRPSS